MGESRDQFYVSAVVRARARARARVVLPLPIHIPPLDPSLACARALSLALPSLLFDRS